MSDPVSEPYSPSQLPLSLRRAITHEPCPEARHGQLRASDRIVDDCWLWDSTRTNNAGYGQVKWRGKVWNTHRLVYHLLVEALIQPGKNRARDGRILDHLCEVRLCCNPEHLEHISQALNTTRGARHRKD